VRQLPMAAAVRRGADGRLPGAVGHRDRGRAGARRALGAARRGDSWRNPLRIWMRSDAFLKGEEASKSMGGDRCASLRRAVDFYEHAVAIDATFARAWARLSRASSS